MVRSRLGLKALGLCALLLGLMAFASAAQAETGAKWAILKANGELVTISPTGDGKGIGDALLPSIGGEIDGASASLLTEVSKKVIALSCTGATLEGGILELLGKLGEGSATFTGCITKIGGVTQPACKPHSKGATEGTVKSQKGYGLMKLHSGTPTVLVLPVTGETFASLVLGTEGESECAIGEVLPVSGKLSAIDSNGLFTTHEVKHLIKEFAALTDLWVLNKTAEHKATIDGAAWAFLIGAHEGLKWSGLV